MKLYRVQAVMLRHLLLSFRVFGNVINLFYWPLLNILLWGFNSVWNEQTQHQPAEVTLALLTALMLWQILFRLNMEICINLFDEIQSHDFSSLFSTPLTLAEWSMAVVGLGFLKSIITFIFANLMIFILYSVNILTLGWYLVPFLGLIALTGWAVGFLTACGIVYWGKSVHELVWVCVWAFVPFSGIFYSVTVLPKWAQYIAALIPQSYLFEALRTFILHNALPLQPLLISFLLSILYLCGSLVFFNYSFEKSKSKGLSRLEH